MDLAVAAACGLLGLLVGSFANVVIYRVPAGKSIVSPPSACPSCGTPVQPRDNIPIVSWLVLRGRCRHCSEPISVEYPIVEALTAVLFAAVGARVGVHWALPGFLLFTWVLVVVSVIDLHTRKIPNKIMYPMTPVLLVAMAVAALLTGEPEGIIRIVVGGLAGFLGLLVLALINPRGMGMGDVKLAGFIGIGLGYLSLWHVLLGLFAGFLVGGVVAIGLLLTRVRDRKAHIPFGPYLAAGAMIALLFGTPLLQAYARSLGATFPAS